MTIDKIPERFSKRENPIYTQCALCGSAEPLCNSHIMPKFVFKWQKATGGNIREFANVNKRVQDGLKLKMLCKACETLFSTYEKTFSEQFFMPIASERASSITYGPWLSRFCVSVSWRILRFIHDSTEHYNDATTEQQTLIINALATWKDFLLNLRSDPDIFDQNICINAPILDAVGTNVPNNINRFMMRHTYITLCGGNHSLFTFAKMGSICIFGSIQRSKKTQFDHPRIALRHNKFDSNLAMPPSWAIDFYANEANKLKSLFTKMSSNQRQKVNNWVDENIEFLQNSDHWEALQYDKMAFGKKAIISDK